jgi:Tfp pilus assembly protein PilZ
MTRATLSRAGEGVPPEPVLRKIRVPFVQKARFVHGGSPRDVFLVDLGLAGVFAELDTPVPIGDVVEISFPLPGNEIQIAARCRVAWWRAAGVPPSGLPAGVGLEFIEVSASDRDRLRAHLADHLRRNPRLRRFARPWPVADGQEEDR